MKKVYKIKQILHKKKYYTNNKYPNKYNLLLFLLIKFRKIMIIQYKIIRILILLNIMIMKK